MKQSILNITLVAVTTAFASFATPSGVTAAEPIPGEEHCVVNVASGDALNIREQPSAGAAVEAKLSPGSCGVVVSEDCQGNWCPIDNGHFSGWVSKRYLSPVSPSRYCVTDVSPSDRLNLRAGPSTQSQVLAKLAPNACDIAFLPFADGAWQKIRTNGWEGWVNRRYLSGQ